MILNLLNEITIWFAAAREYFPKGLKINMSNDKRMARLTDGPYIFSKFPITVLRYAMCLVSSRQYSYEPFASPAKVHGQRNDHRDLDERANGD